MSTAITRQESFELHGTAGDDGGAWKKTINFAPARVSARVALVSVGGGGLSLAGIVEYSYRPDPKGADKVVHLGSDWPQWKSFVEAVDGMTSITWGIAAGAGQELHARLDLSFWS